MPFYVFNFTDGFGEQVMDRFVDAYERGATPNPCIDCNRYMKFAKLVERAELLGCDAVATGHYARIEQENGRWLLKKAVDDSKSGFAAEDILPLMEKIGEFSNICIKGLMAIPPISHISGENQKFFQKMFHLSVDIRQKKYDNVKVDCLSMGMSGDFADAIASGSTMVRVGTAIFGARDYARDSSK